MSEADELFVQSMMEQQALIQQIHELDATRRYAQAEGTKLVEEKRRLEAEICELRILIMGLPVSRGRVAVHRPCVGAINGTYDVRLEWQDGNTFNSIRMAQCHVKEEAEALARLLDYRRTMDAGTKEPHDHEDDGQTVTDPSRQAGADPA